MSEPLRDGSPSDLAWARIDLTLANLRWRGSMNSELFQGVVTFPFDELVAAEDEFRAATKRHRVWLDQRADTPRRTAASSGAAHELEFYGGAA